MYNFAIISQVRAMAGCLVEVGLGRMSIDELEEVVQKPSNTHRVKHQKCLQAPPGGLYLLNVHYNKEGKVRTSHHTFCQLLL